MRWPDGIEICNPDRALPVTSMREKSFPKVAPRLYASPISETLASVVKEFAPRDQTMAARWMPFPIKCLHEMGNFMSEPGQIIILNGAPRSGKSSIVQAVQESFEGPWMNLGVDTYEQVTPLRCRSRIAVVMTEIGHDIQPHSAVGGDRFVERGVEPRHETLNIRALAAGPQTYPRAPLIALSIAPGASQACRFCLSVSAARSKSSCRGAPTVRRGGDM